MSEDPAVYQVEFSNGWVPTKNTQDLIHSFTPVRRFSKFWCHRGFSNAYKHKVLWSKWAIQFRFKK